MLDWRPIRLFLIGLLVPFLILRVWLNFFPDSDFDVAGYNIHHLYTGLLLIAAAGVPLALGAVRGRERALAVLAFAVGLSLALDEWVYLIVTDGSNAAYLTPESFWGGVVMIGLTAIYAAAWARRRSE